MCSVSDDTQDVYHKWTRTNSTDNDYSGVREKESEKRKTNTQNILQMSNTFLVEILFSKERKIESKMQKKTNSTTKIIQSIKKKQQKIKSTHFKTKLWENCSKI